MTKHLKDNYARLETLTSPFITPSSLSEIRFC